MSDDQERLIEFHRQCDEFFRDILGRVIKSQRLHISELASFYLLSLLLRGARTEQPDSYIGNQTVAEEFAKEMFRDAGDHSLIIAGILWETLIKKPVKVDYYIDMGAWAYKRESESTTSDELSSLFEELSSEFSRLVTVLTKAARFASKVKMSDLEILDIYQKWLQTRKPELAEELRRFGINPDNISPRKQ